MKRSFLIIIFIFFITKNIIASYKQFKIKGNLSTLFYSILDDFNDLNNINNWRLFTYAGGDGNSGSCYYYFQSNNGDGYLTLNYNISGNGSFSWYVSKMGMENLMVSNFNLLKFKVKGKNNNEYFKITLKTGDCNISNRRVSSIYIADFLTNKVTTDWQEVEIPLKNFSNLTNFSKMYEFTIVFENYFSLLNAAPLNSELYIDNIRFTNSNKYKDELIIDNFNDKNFFSSLGTVIETFTGNGASGDSGFSSLYFNSPYSLVINYTNIMVGTYPDGWIVTIFRFGGGNDNKTSLPVDISNYTNLIFYARNRDNKNNPKQFQIILKDINTSQIVYTAESSGGNNPIITTNWQKLKIPLANFSNLDLKNITEIDITINQWCSDLTNMGSAYIDKIFLR